MNLINFFFLINQMQKGCYTISCNFFLIKFLYKKKIDGKMILLPPYTLLSFSSYGMFKKLEQYFLKKPKTLKRKPFHALLYCHMKLCLCISFVNVVCLKRLFIFSVIYSLLTLFICIISFYINIYITKYYMLLGW